MVKKAFKNLVIIIACLDTIAASWKACHLKKITGIITSSHGELSASDVESECSFIVLNMR